MDGTFSNLNGIEVFFLICGFVGGLFVVMRLILQFFGGIGHGHDLNDMDTDHADSDASFKALSIQGLTAFAMMFGLVGFALYRQSLMGLFLSLLGGAAAGVASVWVIAKIFSFMLSLQTSGNISMEEAIGGEGKVYLTIPPRGTGRVSITFKNHLREYDAVSHDGEGIRTGEPVRVIRAENNILTVERITRQELPQA